MRRGGAELRSKLTCAAGAQMGDTCELSVRAAALCGEGEELSYWQLMVRDYDTGSCWEVQSLSNL